ncbi:hypothetical protein M758_3G247100 [Ceratodon purpureus]|uniref:Uncharacterized protein n=1 Tax=Ceratodon purpureus TaxID=3225 RepID=A0A8T0IQ44_CERPU|nr:hypothetical protein KC19_3G246800 [Ceratodon purpureus]KAG0624430.1 hypothetical protein M758_3G247100 [Ceratodon purpureus]
MLRWLCKAQSFAKMRLLILVPDHLTISNGLLTKTHTQQVSINRLLRGKNISVDVETVHF